MDYTLWHLKKAARALAHLIRDLEGGDVDGFTTGVDVAHVYHHLNTAWNARAASDEATEACSEQDFYRWRRFPDDLYDNFTGVVE